MDTRTFKGIINYNERTWYGASKWEYVMIFNKDGSKIVGG